MELEKVLEKEIEKKKQEAQKRNESIEKVRLQN